MTQLYDHSPRVVAVCAFLIPLCTFFICLRLGVRWHKQCLGIDDWLLVTGLALWIISTALVFPAAYNGLGAHSNHHTHEQYEVAMKYFFLFQDFYVWANIPIKISLCLTLARLAESNRLITAVLYATMVLIFTSSVGTNIYLLTNCQPIAALWDYSIPGAHCRPSSGTVTLGVVYSVINIVVDWTVALLPVFFLWRIRMPRTQKVTVMCVLSLGIFASCATLVRLTTLQNFNNRDDYLFGLASIVLWTVAELALALIAGSLATLRPLLRRFFAGAAADSPTLQQQEAAAGRGRGIRSPGPMYSLRTIGQKSSHARTQTQESQLALEAMLHSGDSMAGSTVWNSREWLPSPCDGDGQFFGRDADGDEEETADLVAAVLPVRLKGVTSAGPKFHSSSSSSARPRSRPASVTTVQALPHRAGSCPPLPSSRGLYSPPPPPPPSRQASLRSAHARVDSFQIFVTREVSIGEEPADVVLR